MATEEEENGRFVGEFHTLLKQHTPEFLQLLVNSHFEIEGDLDAFLQEMFVHPKYVEEARLTFAQKVAIVRAYAGAFSDRPEWKIMSVFNTIRNGIAHRSRHKPHRIGIEQLRDITIATYTDKKKLRAMDIEKLVVYAALACCGFLQHLTDALKRAQGKQVEDDD
jgi:hypothetical protein